MMSLGTNVNVKQWSSRTNGGILLFVSNDEPMSGRPTGGGSS